VSAPVPALDLSPEIDSLWEELQAAITRVTRSGHFILGPEVEAFEAEAAAYLGVRHAVAVNSGTDALVIALRALGIGPGDEVITTPFSFVATAEAISLVGATPVFADIDPATFNLQPDTVAAKVTSRTRAIIPVHLYGQAADMEPILDLVRRRGLKVVEDVAQAFGGRYKGQRLGTLGDAAAFSFFPSKILGAFGDGGLVVTNSEDVAASARMLRSHGSRKKYYNEVTGYNSRLDALQAAVLRVKLPHVDEYVAGRQQAASRYDRLLARVSGVIVPPARDYATHVYHQYTVRVPEGRRDAVQAFLSAAGISTTVYYPVPLHRLPVYSSSGGAFPVAEQAAREVLSLPIWPQMDESVQRRVVDALAAAVGASVADRM